MIAPRRMTFQLTPLLDLLLIVIFAQFMEVQQTSSKSEESLETRVSEMRQRLLADAESLRQKMDLAHAERMQKVDQRRNFYDNAFKSVLQQQNQSGEVLAEVFDLSAEEMKDLLKIDPASKQFTPEQRENLRRTLKEMQKKDGRQLLQLLISYGEMRKRCDVWEVHVNSDGAVRFDNGLQTRLIRAESQQEAGEKLFEAYKTFEEPKTLVILLYSYGDTTAGQQQRIRNALPGLMAKMREDSGGRHWFEFAVLGFTPEGPTLRGENR